MEDLSNIDLDGDSESTPAASSGGAPVEDLSLGAPLSDEEKHAKTEDLHLYFRQRFKDKVGATGIFIISLLVIFFVMTVGLLFFSYTPSGRNFLQGLKIILF